MADIVPLSTRVEGPGTRLASWNAPRIHDRHQPAPGVLGIVRRRRWIILGCVALTMLFGAILSLQLTPIYSASASLRIDEQPSNVQALDLLNSLKGTEISTEIQVLSSKTLARAVVDSLGLELQLASPRGVSRSEVFPYVEPVRTEITAPAAPPPGFVGKLANSVKGMFATAGAYALDRQSDGRYRLTDREEDKTLATVAVGDTIALGGMRFVFAPAGDGHDHYTFDILPSDLAADNAQSTISVSRPVQLANIAVVSYESPDPELASGVPNMLTALYLSRRHSQGRQGNENTVEFLREQLKQLGTTLAAQEDSLRRFREANSAISLQDEASTDVQRLAELRAQRNQVDAERAALESLIKNVQAPVPSDSSRASRYRYLVAFPTLLANQAASGLLQALNDAEGQRATLLTKRTPADPEVIALDTRIRNLEGQINSMVNTYYRGLTDQVAALDQSIAQSQSRMSSIPRKEVELGRLERQPKVLGDLYTMLQTRLKEAEIAAASVDPSVHVVDNASIPRKPSRPKPLLNLILAAAAGLAIGLAAAFAREAADKNIHSRMDIQSTTQVPVLGLIPRIDPRQSSILPNWASRRSVRIPPQLRGNGNGSSPTPSLAGSEDPGVRAWLEAPALMESFNRLAVNVAFLQQGQRLKALAVTSPVPGEGKTTVAINLAVAMAQRGSRVLLMDADMRRGRIHGALKTSRSPGLAEVLHGEIAVEQAVNRLRFQGGTSVHFLAAGRLLENPALVLTESGVSELLQRLEDSYDLVILDTPPLNAVSDAMLFGSAVGGVVLVARSGVTASGALTFAMEQLENIQVNVIGTVLNDINFDRDAQYDPAYRYYRYDPDSYVESK
ncbi:MAG TPA: polysaccharide biosynthesis tyrosine autokinase [Gemmatimonadaceae bacterium]|nr:polysaccharide biosynthesis tyrosine autokinase [Gemmatimonadaceae bacterium]